MRIGGFICKHETITPEVFSHEPWCKWVDMHTDFGVDSGQFGMFDAAYYPEGDDLWYDQMCELTLGGMEQWGVWEYGINSSSGLGDGSYCGQCVKNEAGEIVAFRITFIEEDIEEEHCYACGETETECECAEMCDDCGEYNDECTCETGEE